MSLAQDRTTPARAPVGLFQAVGIVARFVRARIQLRGTERGARIRSAVRLLVPQRAGVAVGQRTVFLGGPIPTSLRCARGAELTIGERSVVNYGVDVSASRSVRIGSDCMIASLVHIRDDDGRHAEPVVIGKNVWIAYGAVIEPGAVIGDGSVISAMSVVSGVVPPRSLAAGNPATWLPLDAPPAPAAPAAFASTDAHTGPRRPTPEVVRRAVIDWLDEARLFGEAATLLTGDTISLRKSGLLDSLGMVELLAALEHRFGIAIDRERAGGPEADTLKAIVELVSHSKARAS